MATPATADELSRLSDDEKFNLLTLLVEDYFQRETPRPVVLRRGDRPVGTLIPNDVWSCLPHIPITPEELARRVRTAGRGITTEQLVERLRAGLSQPTTKP